MCEVMSVPKDDDEEQSIEKKIQELRKKYSDDAKQAEQKVSRAALESEKIDLKTKSEIRKLRMKY